MLGFTPPMLASSGRPSGPLDDWVVEPEADGWRGARLPSTVTAAE